MTGYLRDKLWIRQVPSYYSSSQVVSYLLAVGFHEGDEFSHSLETLTNLVRHHLLTFPFENTAMHYTASHDMDVTPEGAFERLVLGRKGSYCFGMNTVLLGILRGLGFRAYSGAARVNLNMQKLDEPAHYSSHSHMVIFVQPYDHSNRTWVVDVGFGGGGLARPIPLVAGEDSIVQGVSPTEMHRLVKGPFPESSLAVSLDSDQPSGQDLWTMQTWKGTKGDVGNHSKGPWYRQYTFSEQEFFPRDYIDASFVIDHGTESLFARQLMCVKHFVDEEGGGADLYRVVLFGNEVKRQIHGEAEVLRTLHSELDRLKALREVFGVVIEDDAIDHIKGRVTAFSQ